jgi:hypothetical protein
MAALTNAGAEIVIAEEMESIVRIFSQVMHEYGIPSAEISANEAGPAHGRYAALLRKDTSGRRRVTFVPSATQDVLASRSDKACAAKCPGCEECLKLGDKWVHLRLCMICGHVGCCDSSKNKMSSGHFRRRAIRL